jgi:nitrogen fixation protein NifQ
MIARSGVACRNRRLTDARSSRSGRVRQQRQLLGAQPIDGGIDVFARGLPATQWLRGLDAADCADLMEALFPGAAECRLSPLPAGNYAAHDAEAELADLLQLLLEAAKPVSRQTHWLACAVASAALFDNHLWQDLRLPDRRSLSALLAKRFPDLTRRNTGNMRWKSFFYKQLCERAGMICRAPSCGARDDYAECFGPE